MNRSYPGKRGTPISSRGCTESQTLLFHRLCPVEGCGGELITCSKAVKIIDECVLFNPRQGRGAGGGGGCRKGERERDREERREGVVAREGGREAGKVLISAL